MKEACKSAASVQDHNNHPITIITNQDIPDVDVFDSIKKPENPVYTWGDKIRNFLNSDYEETLLLDTDTYICGDLSHIFELLEEYEIAIAEDPYLETAPVDGVPDAFPEYNTGVVAYRQTKEIYDLVERWTEYYFQGNRTAKDTEGAGDQPAFRKAIYDSNAKMTVLPTEYNCRYSYAGCLHKRAIILHGRVPYIEEFSEELNSNPNKLRVFYHTRTEVNLEYYGTESS
jgi:hypothetical protein